MSFPLKIKFLLLILVLCPAFCLAADAPQILITWQAQNFVPAGYPGKILPTTGTRIKAGVEVLKDGKLLDLSKNRVQWFLDDDLLDRELGLKEIVFRIVKPVGYSHYLRVAIDYEGEQISAGKEILIIKPKVVIKTPLFNQISLPLGKNLLQALPYFFNVVNLKDIIFHWTVNEQKLQGNDFLELELTPPLPTGHRLNIKVAGQNTNSDLEFGFSEINLNVQQ